MITYQANGIEITDQVQKQVENVLTLEVGNKNNTYLIQLYCPMHNSPQLPKWKWALVFPTESTLDKFLKEVDQTEEKRARLGIVQYSVFANVMFAFLRKQVKLNIWCSYIKEIIKYQPIGIFVFNERFKHLVELVDKKTSLYYRIDWRHYMVQKKYSFGANGVKVSNSDSEQMSMSMSPEPLKKYKPIEAHYSQPSIPQPFGKRKRGRPRKIDVIARMKQQNDETLSNHSKRENNSEFIKMLDSLNTQFTHRIKRTDRCKNFILAKQINQFSNQFLEKFDHQNQFLKGFFDCLVQMTSQNE